jgi:hypothetical protein
LSLHSSKAPQGIDLSRPLFTYTNANQAAIYTCNTRPRVSPHSVDNNSSQLGATIPQSSDAPVLTRVLRFEVSGLHCRTPVRPTLHTGQTGPMLLHLLLRSLVFTLWINQGTKWFSGEPPEPPRTRCSLRQSPLMTRLPRSPSSTLV